MPGLARETARLVVVQYAASPEELAEVAEGIRRWLDEQLAENPVVAAVVADDDPDVLRWFVRVTGDEKDVFSIYFHLRQRTLHYETFVMPAPEENHEQFYAYLLRRNTELMGAAFGIGDEEAIFLAGSLPISAVDDDELDRILGSLYVWVERFFKSALRIGYASRFK